MTFQEYMAAVASYVAAALAICVEHSTGIVQILGFVLLVSRLIKEVPVAVRTIHGWITRG